MNELGLCVLQFEVQKPISFLHEVPSHSEEGEEGFANRIASKVPTIHDLR